MWVLELLHPGFVRLSISVTSRFNAAGFSLFIAHLQFGKNKSQLFHAHRSRPYDAFPKCPLYTRGNSRTSPRRFRPAVVQVKPLLGPPRRGPRQGSIILIPDDSGQELSGSPSGSVLPNSAHNAEL